MRFIDDTHWGTVKGGYRMTYDPRTVLRNLAEKPSEADWSELWNELHHQGDVDEASYAAVPVLVEILQNSRSLGWNVYALCAIIEIERHRKTNPPLPDWVQIEYESAWRLLPALALRDLQDTQDRLLVQSAISVVAIGKGMPGLGALLSWLDDSELQVILDDKLDWSVLYNVSEQTEEPGATK